MRFAQSRGECPGSRMTFLEGCFEEGRLDAVGAAERVGGASERVGGMRRVEAADGGGRRVDDTVGGTGRELLLCCGREGGCILSLALGLSRGPGRAGGCIFNPEPSISRILLPASAPARSALDRSLSHFGRGLFAASPSGAFDFSGFWPSEPPFDTFFASECWRTVFEFERLRVSPEFPKGSS